ncbi:MAG: hypothetical protein ACRC62_15625 [Microcoleus sp.]
MIGNRTVMKPNPIDNGVQSVSRCNWRWANGYNDPKIGTAYFKGNSYQYYQIFHDKMNGKRIVLSWNRDSRTMPPRATFKINDELIWSVANLLTMNATSIAASNGVQKVGYVANYSNNYQTVEIVFPDRLIGANFRVDFNSSAGGGTFYMSLPKLYDYVEQDVGVIKDDYHRA